MPTYVVTGPDGKRYRVTAPEGATQQEVLARVQGQAQAPKPRQKGTWLSPLTDAVNETLIGVAEGAYNLGAAITDPVMTAIYGKKAMAEQRRQRANFFDNASRTLSTRENPVLRTTGQMVPGVIAGGAVKAPAIVKNAAPRLAPIVTRAVQGAVGSAPVHNTKDSATNSMVTGAALNVTLPMVGGLLANTKLGGRVIDKARQFADDVLVGNGPSMTWQERFLGAAPQPRIPTVPGNVPRASSTASAPGPRTAPPPQQPPLAVLGNDAVERAARFERVGVRQPTTGMITRDPTVWTRERNLMALDEGLPVKTAILNVQDDLANAGRNMSAGAPSSEATGASVRQLIEGRNQRLGQEVSNLYTQAREKFGDVQVGELDGLWTRMADPAWRNNATFGGMNSQITGLLKDFGVIDDMGRSIPGRSLTLSQANELRKFIGRLGNGADQTVIAARKNLITALDNDVFANVGDDAFRQARTAAANRFREFESGLVNKMAKDGIFDEKLPTRMVQGGVSNQQVRDLYKTLKAEGEAGQQAITQLRARAFADLIENPAVMMDDGTTTTVNGKTLWNNFQKNRDRYKVVFGDEMFGQVEDYIKTARDATVAPALATPNTSNTAAMLMNQRPSAGSLFEVPTAPRPGLLTRNAPTIGATVGSLLGGATGGIPGGATGAGVGAGLGRGWQSLAANRGQQAVADATARQVQQAINPQSVAEAVQLLQSQSLNTAQRASVIRWLGQNVGPYSGTVATGLLHGN